MKYLRLLLLLIPLLAAAQARAADGDDDIYQEDALKPLLDKLPSEKDQEKKEQALVLPPYPSEKNLLEVDVARFDFPYRLFIDSASLSVGDDRIVRYTAVLRSQSGVDNISFEGIRCPSHEFKRYAYASGGRFHVLGGAQWQRIHSTRQDYFRRVLADDYLCPLPGADQVAGIIHKLKRKTSGLSQDDL